MAKVGGYKGYSRFRELKLAGEPMPGYRFGSLPLHLRCTCTAKATGGRCRNPAAKGQTLCRTHGAKGLKMSRAKALRLAARMRGERPKNYWCD